MSKCCFARDGKNILEFHCESFWLGWQVLVSTNAFWAWKTVSLSQEQKWIKDRIKEKVNTHKKTLQFVVNTLIKWETTKPNAPSGFFMTEKQVISGDFWKRFFGCCCKRDWKDAWDLMWKRKPKDNWASSSARKIVM